jgi:predicted anti-sigma-YlaC factor YlaD
VAVLLGWAFAGETMTLRTLAAAVVIVGAVALIIRYGSRRGAGSAAREEAVSPDEPTAGVRRPAAAR